jgi:transcriptional repressor NrdR
MRCPFCGHVDTKVTDSREADDGIRRRRECLGCGKRFTTYERVQAVLMVVKKDGRREEFSREKVRSGIRRACAKLPVGAAEIDAIVEDVEMSLLARGVPEVAGTDIGDLVMDSLRELNYAAYVRFASHYRDFVSLEELQAEIERSRTAPRRSPRRAGAAQPPLLPPAAIESQQAPVSLPDRQQRRAGRR